MYFIQMSGVPGSGKSTIARAIALELPAIALDHDDTKSAILESGVSAAAAGAASYEVIKVLADRFLEQGNSVVVDSPCLYAELLDHGIQTSQRHGAKYRYIECQLADLTELDRRLRARPAKTSQLRSLDQQFSHAGRAPRLAKELISEWLDQSHRPVGSYLTLDTSRTIPQCIQEALCYISGANQE